MIEIDVGPNLVTFGTFILSWHGFFSFIAVASAVFLVGRWAPARGIDPDDIYSVAIWAIIGGVIGARIVHVIDQWSFYQGNLIQIAYIWSGGIALWGGLLGGFLGGAAYTCWRNDPLCVRADLAGPPLLHVPSQGLCRGKGAGVEGWGGGPAAAARAFCGLRAGMRACRGAAVPTSMIGR